MATTTKRATTKRATARASAPAVPQVKQCVEIGHWQFGCTATAAGDNRWLVASPENGGHWATDDEVQDWAEHPVLDAVEPTDETKGAAS